MRAEDEVCLCPIHRSVCMWSAGFCFGCVPVILPIPAFLSCKKPILSSRLKRKFGRRSVFGETLFKLNSPQQWHIPPTPPLAPTRYIELGNERTNPHLHFPTEKTTSLSLSLSPSYFWLSSILIKSPPPPPLDSVFYLFLRRSASRSSSFGFSFSVYSLLDRRKKVFSTTTILSRGGMEVHFSSSFCAGRFFFLSENFLLWHFSPCHSIPPPPPFPLRSPRREEEERPPVPHTRHRECTAKNKNMNYTQRCLRYKNHDKALHLRLPKYS